MAKIVTDTDQIISWIKAKQTNEQELLRRLYHAFNQPLPFQKVNQVVISGLARMMIEMGSHPQPVVDTLNKESGLVVWRHVTAPPTEPKQRLVEMLNELVVSPYKFDVGDLSNLIRVIGGWLEAGGGFGNVMPKNKEEEKQAITEAFRSGLTQDGKTWDEAKAEIWDKGEVRQREDRIADPLLYHLIEAHVRSAWVRPPAGGIVGLQMFRVNRDDLVRKIDLIFGLLKGATISGTTTDTALVLEAFGAQHNLHAGYYLFPVATIAARLHHTLVEAGLALTLVGALDCYRVGFYKTLAPIGGLPGELGSVGGILDAAENDARNRHFMVWYNASERPAGCILWEKPELNAVRDSVCDGKRLLQKVRSMPALPRRNDIVGYINEAAPGLLSFDLKRQLFAIP